MSFLSSLKKWALVIVLLLSILFACTYLFFINEIDQMLGGNTEQFDSSQLQALSGRVAIHNVNVLATDSQTMRTNQSILVKGKQIEFVGSRTEIPYPESVLESYHQIDGSGRYVIPGLIDSHVHVKKSKNDLLLYIANGVTQIGEMTGMPHHFDYLAKINQGAVGPQMFIASPKINSRTDIGAKFRSQFEKRHQSFTSLAQAEEAVRQFKAKGYDAIKLSSDLDRKIYYAINKEALKLGIPVIGHLPVGLQLEDLYQSGQSQLAHIDSITHNLMNEFGGLSSANSKDFLAHIHQQADTIAANLKDRDIALASTVWLHHTRPQQDFELANFIKSIQIEYQNPGWLEGSFVSKGCLPGENSYENSHNTEQHRRKESEVFYQTYNHAIKIVTQALVRHQVAIVAGTDALGACGMIPGFSLHKELQALNSLGLSPAQVLHAATVSAADWMGINAGRIAVNYRADLVLLDDNPLENIQNTESIYAVMANGQYWQRQELGAMLDAVKLANNNSRKITIEQYTQ